MKTRYLMQDFLPQLLHKPTYS